MKENKIKLTNAEAEDLANVVLWRVDEMKKAKCGKAMKAMNARLERLYLKLIDHTIVGGFTVTL